MAKSPYTRFDPEKVIDLAPGYKGGDEPPGGTEMEARVKRLEDDMKEIKADLKSLLKDSNEIKGKVSNMPSTWQMIGICGVMIGLVLAACGFAFTLAKFLQT